MPKFKLKKYQKPNPRQSSTCFRVPEDIIQTFLTIQGLTGLSKQELIEQMVRHCLHDIEFLKQKPNQQKG